MTTLRPQTLERKIDQLIEVVKAYTLQKKYLDEEYSEDKQKIVDNLQKDIQDIKKEIINYGR